MEAFSNRCITTWKMAVRTCSSGVWGTEEEENGRAGPLDAVDKPANDEKSAARGLAGSERGVVLAARG